jgi:hypothetical protein
MKNPRYQAMLFLDDSRHLQRVGTRNPCLDIPRSCDAVQGPESSERGK